MTLLLYRYTVMLSIRKRQDTVYMLKIIRLGTIITRNYAFVNDWENVNILFESIIFLNCTGSIKIPTKFKGIEEIAIH